MMRKYLNFLFIKRVTLNKKRNIMSEKKFSKKHEWVELNGEVATVGITKHATEMLGDIVFVEVPEIGKSVDKDGQAAVVESTKAASDVYSPVSGEITEGNKSIVGTPESVNSDPEGASWFFKVKIKDKSELDTLMSKTEYDKFIEENPS
jgi:glycine cleavage system H protein